MLRELHISNLAVIADARVELGAGLNCFTGATGAGKSLVIGALELLLGLRTGNNLVRPDVDEARITGVFDLSNREQIRQIEKIADLTLAADGGELIVTRRLYASGRSSASVNGNPVTLTMLKLVAEHLVDVHGQHDHQFLLRPSNQLMVLDQFGGLLDLRNEYHDAYEQLVETRARLKDLSASQELRRQQLDLYRFQANEIDAAELSPGEYESLEQRSDVLKNLEKLKKESGSAYAALYEADGAILERLKTIGVTLGELADLDKNLADVAKAIGDATLQLEESSFDLSRYLDKLDVDPAESAEVDERLNTINRILNKYGNTVDQTLAYRQEIGSRIAGLEQSSEDLSALTKRLVPLGKQVVALGKKLSDARGKTAQRLSPLIEKQLAELGMEKATFSIAIETASFDDESAAAPSGFDTLEFVARTNPGMSPQPLRKIASGGELGRIMLATKGILASSDRISVLVFDEIDANVGGRLGAVIGRKLRALAQHHQVLCITHLPQIAAYADRHLTVRKQVVGKETRTTVRLMTGDERIEELAEMTGGQKVTETTRAQARELLADAAAEPTGTRIPTASSAKKPPRTATRVTSSSGKNRR